MAINFPTSLDTLTNPTASDYLNSPSHAAQHANANDILEALEAKVGIDSSAVTTSHDYKLQVASGAEVNTGTDNNKKVTPKAIADSFIGVQGGWSPLGACTYEGADDPTFTFSIASDMTGILSAGMRIKLTQTTVKYFIITGVGAYSGGKTIITVYGGTDYDLANAAITVPFYSTQKTPFGFPLNPSKWSVVVSDGSNRSQGSPTANTYYSVSEFAMSIPIGSWYVGLSVTLEHNSAGANRAGVAISSANNAVTNGVKIDRYIPTAGQWIFPVNVIENIYPKTVTSKTTYYVLIWTENSSVTSIGLRNDINAGYFIITCAYL